MKNKTKKYFGFCIINYVAYNCLNNTVHHKIERDGYVYVNKEQNTNDKIVGYSVEATLLTIPFVNILATAGGITTLLNKKAYEEYKRTLLEKGTIVENTNKVKIKTK